MSHLADLASLLAILAAILGWLQLSRGRELAAKLAQRLCQRQGLQLLDETVGLRSLRLSRQQGRWQLLRGYSFEVSISGTDRVASRLWMAGEQVTQVQLPPSSHASAVVNEPTAATAPHTAQIIDLTSRIRRNHPASRPH